MPHMVFGTADDLERGLLEFRRTMYDFSGVDITGWRSSLSGGAAPCNATGNVSNWQYFDCAEMSIVMVKVEGLKGEEALSWKSS